MPIPIEVGYAFTGGDGAAWDAAVFPTIRDGGRPDPSTMPTIQADAGVMTVGPGDSRVVAFTADDMENFDLTVSFQNTSGQVTFDEIGYRVGSNVTTGTPTAGYVMQVEPVAGNVNLRTINAYDQVAVVHDQSFDDDLVRYFRVRVKADRHQIKWWLAGDSEPPTWGIDTTDATYTSGRIFLGCYNGADETEVTVTWDDLSILELVPPDPGLRLGGLPLVGAYVGAAPLIACYVGDVELPVP